MINDKIQQLLLQTGIKLNGSNSCDIKVNNDRLYKRVLTKGSLGFGEAYMDGWWDCEHIDELIDRLLRDDIRNQLRTNLPIIMLALASILFNRQSGKKAYNIGKAHYDIGNDLYKAMLDKNMVYTCGYWKGVDNLDDAQEQKLDLVCKKIGLKQGDKVLDIGCGWGSFAKFAAKNYGASVVGITVSDKQAELAKELCKGLSVEIRYQDYRDVNEKFDHIVSLGMFEHVGHKNYKTYFKVVERCLNNNGLLLLHTIGSKKSSKSTDAWIDKYIFPGGMLPSLAQITKSIEGLMMIEDVHNFGADYDKTLMAWFENFDKHWDELKDQYDERFYRMWKYYLLSCAGSFRCRQNQLWQIVMSKKGIVGGYKSIR
jgi:cyclopropane-fatty-acyl-phospholipid synthase